jgi:hypothetical protein
MKAKRNLLLLAGLLLTMFNIESSAQDQHDRLYRIRVNDKYGFINRQGRVVVPPTLANAEEFSEGLALVTKKDRVGFIDSHGTMVIEPVFYRAESFADGLALVLAAGGEKGNGVWAYIDRTGKIVFQLFDYSYPSFDPQSFSEGLAAYCKNDKWGYIDKSGKTVIEPQFDRAFAFSEGLAKVRVGEQYGFINSLGQFVIKPQFPRPVTVDILMRPRPTDHDLSFHDGLASVETWPDHQWAYIDQTGKVVFRIPPNHYSRFSFSEGLVRMRNAAGDEGFFDTKGKVAIEGVWRMVEDFSGGLAAVEWRNSTQTPCEHNNCWGYIDHSGKVVIGPRFSTAQSFHGDLAWVSITIPRLNWSDSYKQGYIDRTGKFVWSIIIR